MQDLFFSLLLKPSCSRDEITYLNHFYIQKCSNWSMNFFNHLSICELHSLIFCNMPNFALLWFSCNNKIVNSLPLLLPEWYNLSRVQSSVLSVQSFSGLVYQKLLKTYIWKDSNSPQYLSFVTQESNFVLIVSQQMPVYCNSLET